MFDWLKADDAATKAHDYRAAIIDETGSAERYADRVRVYDAKRMPRVSHHFGWLVHNCVAHPLIGIAPFRPLFDFHDYTSRRINAAPVR